MSYRFMRVIVFFDFPTLTTEDKRNYSKFRRFLIKNGFMMLQESVYAKLALNSTQVAQIVNEVKTAQPKTGCIQILSVTEKQFAKMEIISGKSNSNVIDTDERLLIL